jgi:hypothetical protein
MMDKAPGRSAAPRRAPSADIAAARGAALSDEKTEIFHRASLLILVA